MSEMIQDIIAVQSYVRRHPDTLTRVPKPLRKIVSRLTEQPSTRNGSMPGSYLSPDRAQEIIEEETSEDFTAADGKRYQRRAVVVFDRRGFADF